MGLEDEVRQILAKLEAPHLDTISQGFLPVTGNLSIECFEQISQALLEAMMVVSCSKLSKFQKQWICAQLSHAFKHLSAMLREGEKE